ncbi:fucose mutarotase isoform X1 [Cricetulus griseus]|uniref:L-fucose mutarotase n=1 Tax=Cricetulus griseus TaxID=10029 RepID=A0A9J7JE78_CRIGR|nr:fucose mutarotase isoform X1 [Cricetulus griseus]XP_027264855.1 fucose mutarotase isoform X1 [Cricetulus griseus]
MCDKFTGSTLAGQEPNHSHQLLAGPWLQRAQDNEMYAGCPKKEFVQALVKLSVLADANFPTSSICQCGPVEIRADGLDIPQILEAVLKLLPLDTYVESPAAVMELVPSDKERGLQTPIWNHYESLLLKADCKKALMKIERFEFYERAKKAFAVVATGEMALYGNIILKKGTLDLDHS